MFRFTILICLLTSVHLAFGQNKQEEKVSNRFFMPSLQVGYLNNHSDQLGGGVFIQTSLEYQTPKGIFFRINYDDYDSRYDLSDDQNSSQTQRGSVSFSELLGGIGYRQRLKKRNVMLAVQTGFRFYGFPLLTIQDNNFILEVDGRNILVNRYTLGYEYEIDTRTFLNLELFGSHTWEKKDYWSKGEWATGITIGITTTIF